jgi:2-octaprenyl-3-methyl-6-methoxy-1,4-benzoquinol hydroxylase/2-octaprenylphenol hydroxylase
VSDRATDFDVVVVGAGMVGAAAAALLARAGFIVAVVESREPRPFDATRPVGLRVSAISPGAAAVLREAGAWRLVENTRHSPYRLMRVEDRDEASEVEFQAPEFGLERLGTIVENDSVQWALWQALAVLPGVERLCPAAVAEFECTDRGVALRLEGGGRLAARLLVGADGADSRIRERLGIRQQFWAYGQSGVVGVVESDPPNPGVAWQRFLDGGPVAFLPLSDGASSIVWSCPERQARRLAALDETDFLAELEQAVAGSPGHWPGRLKAVGPRAAFPLTMRLSERYAARRAVLMGDAAHVMHPLAGQGVNQGLLDAAGLVELLIGARKSGQDVADGKVLQRYDRWRRSEAEVMSRGVHALRGLFLPEGLGLLRRVGLGLVSRSWTAREAFIRRACGLNDNAPALARGKTLVELLR